MEERTLDNVVAELEGLEGLIVTVSTLVAPADYNISAGMPSQRMIDLAFANQVIMIGMLVAFVLTFLCLRFPFSFLPKDQGREYAINGALSKGKIRGVGLILTAVFILGVDGDEQ